jgi:hypothetical protein
MRFNAPFFKKNGAPSFKTLKIKKNFFIHHPGINPFKPTMPTPVWGGGLWALPINPPPRPTPATKVNAAFFNKILTL